MKVLFIRHGQTDFNKEARLQGQEVDLFLNDVGVQQVEDAMQYLPQDIDIIFSSPLKRAHQTAEIINKKFNTIIKLHDGIKEMSFGSLAGKTWPEITTETGDVTLRERHVDTAFDYRPYGGESAEDFKQRIRAFVDEVKNGYHNRIVLVTAHGGVIDTMHLLFPQRERPERGNAQIHEFDL